MEGRGRFPGQTTFRDDVPVTDVFEDAEFLNLYGGEVVASPYEEGGYRFSVSGGSGQGETAVSPTITVWDKEDEVNWAYRKSLTP